MINLNRLIERRKYSIGGARPIFKHNAWEESAWVGSVLSGGLKRGDVLFAGDFGYFDYLTRKSYLLTQFVLAKDLTATDTEVYFLNSDYTHNMRTDMFVTPEPELSTSTNKAVACTSMVSTTLSDVSVYKITITANALGTGTKGDLYVQAAEAGEEVAPLRTEVNVIFQDNLNIDNDLADVMGEDYNSVATITPLIHCTVIAGVALVPKIAPTNKCAVKEFYQL